MASNIYKDPEVKKVLTKKDLNTMTWRSLLLQASFNYERMQAGGWLYTLLPGLKKIHTNNEDLSEAMDDHLQFYNTHPFLVTFIAGIILSMEENKQPREVINGIKVALMGPLGGIGDALFWLTLLPITAGIGSSLSLSGNPLGPVLFLVIFNAVHFALRFWLMNYGYTTGTNAISALKENTKKISRAATIVGLSVVGGLIASYVNFTLPIKIQAGKIAFNLQTDVLDKIMPALLPLGYTALCYWLLKKKEVSPLVLILITVVLGLVLAFFGVFPAK
ncbi:MAG: PTS system mannose-specific EIID component [Peptostreptococcus russellii]